MKFLVNIDLNSNEIQNMVLQQIAGNHGSPVQGHLWYDSTADLPKWYDGAASNPIYKSASTNTATTNVLRDGSGNFAANIGTFVSATLTGSVTNDTDAATKAYVDSVAAGQYWKDAVRLATAAALAANTYNSGNKRLTADANGALSVDGVAVAVNDRILVKNESTGSNRGLYKVIDTGDGSNPYILERTSDVNTSAEVTPGLTVWVNEGSTNGDTAWTLTTDAPITLDTTSLTFTQTGGIAAILAGDGLTKTGNTLDVVTANSARIVVGANSIDLATTVSAGTSTSVTYDVYGRITSGADIITSNGIVVRTGAGTFTNRSVAGTSNRISISNGDGVSGNPTVDIDSAYVGQTSITTLGTIATGTWQGGVVAVAYGGTGASTFTTNGVLLGNTASAIQVTAAGTANQVFRVGGGGGAPAFGAIDLASSSAVGATILAVANGGTGAATPAGARANLSAAGFYATDVGDGAETAYVVTHSLSTRDVIVQVRDNSTPWAYMGVDVEATSTSTVTVRFASAPTSNQYRVVVHANG